MAEKHTTVNTNRGGGGVHRCQSNIYKGVFPILLGGTGEEIDTLCYSSCFAPTRKLRVGEN